jgi:RNA polymerase sigma-70 factor (ECF subfamily)
MHAIPSPLQEPEVFTDLFTRTHLIIFRYIYGLHGGPLQEVEDLTSDTYSRAWKGRMNFTGNEQDALCWLFTIAKNLVIDSHRKNRKKLNKSIERLDDRTLENLFPSTDIPVEEQVANRQQFSHLWDVMQDLPDDRREMLVLRYILGWQVKQIASYLCMEENTVSVYIRRGLELIRRNW